VTKVLIVSEADLAPVLGRTIVWGRDVERVFASSSASALDVARAYVPSLVVLDGTDELATLRLIRQLREHPGTRRSSIVVVTGPGGASPGQDPLQGGANLVLPSPVDPALWDARLTRLLAAARPGSASGPGPAVISEKATTGAALTSGASGARRVRETAVPVASVVSLR
jgi:CheY-like chemotaxis protein